MIKIHGTAVSKGIAIGTVQLYKKQKIEIPSYPAEDVGKEFGRYQGAVHQLEEQFEMLYKKALTVTDEEHAEIFRGYQMLLTDVTFMEEVREKITVEHMNAAAAVSHVCNEFTAMFARMDDVYLRARAVDIQTVSDQLITTLLGMGNLQGNLLEQLANPVILVADELTPDDTIRMKSEMVLGIVTRKGSEISHTSILARSLAIPAVICENIRDTAEGQIIIVDGLSGDIILEPDEETLQMMMEKQNKLLLESEELITFKDKETTTKDGNVICLYANAGSLSDVEEAVCQSAEGIGLFRTEFLFLGRNEEPTEEEQFEIYKKAAQMMQGKKVIFRTADIGSDKQPDYLKCEAEVNPAMGYRAIRIGLEHSEMLKRQLRAIYRASSYGNVSVMYPMITSTDEVKQLKVLSEEVREELMEQGCVLGEVEEGIMVETPAAALISDELAKMVDFFSIGTNDLTAFTLAMDRMNSKLNGYFDPYHESVMRLIEMTVRNGQEAGIWVGICGELAADLNMTERLTAMGIDELSVVPSMVLSLRKQICSISQLTNESEMLYYHHKK